MKTEKNVENEKYFCYIEVAKGRNCITNYLKYLKIKLDCLDNLSDYWKKAKKLAEEAIEKNKPEIFCSKYMKYYNNKNISNLYCYKDINKIEIDYADENLLNQKVIKEKIVNFLEIDKVDFICKKKIYVLENGIEVLKLGF